MTEFEAGIGDPTKPVLTEEEEKRVDADHRPIVNGLVWSQAPTGLYLTIFGTNDLGGPTIGCDRPYVGDMLDIGGLALLVATTGGKPKFTCGGYGASLELPVDLARDDLKKQYVTEWIMDTTREVLTFGGKGVPNDRVAEFGMWLVVTAERAIRATGL